MENETGKKQGGKFPLLIVGYPRSGTTLLYHILMSADEFPAFAFDETHFYSHYFNMYGDLRDERKLKRLIREIGERGIFKGDALLGERIFAGTVGESCDYGRVFSVMMGMLAANQGKDRWIEKTPWHMLFIPQILKDNPDARFILTVRDPRAVALSVCRAGWAKGFLSGPLRVIWGWKWHMARMVGHLRQYRNRILVVRYEDMVDDLPALLEKINAFLNIHLTTELIQQKRMGVMSRSNSSFSADETPASGVYKTAVDRWKKKLPEDTLAELEFMVEKEMKTYGYTPFARRRVSGFRAMQIQGGYRCYALVKQICSAYPVRRVMRQFGNG